jgi:hypothetical protein
MRLSKPLATRTPGQKRCFPPVLPFHYKHDYNPHLELEERKCFLC